VERLWNDDKGAPTDRNGCVHTVLCADESTQGKVFLGLSLLTNNVEASTEPLPDCHHKSPAVWLGDLSSGEFVAQFLT
jgi:hypothetical protein